MNKKFYLIFIIVMSFSVFSIFVIANNLTYSNRTIECEINSSNDNCSSYVNDKENWSCVKISEKGNKEKYSCTEKVGEDLLSDGAKQGTLLDDQISKLSKSGCPAGLINLLKKSKGIDGYLKVISNFYDYIDQKKGITGSGKKLYYSTIESAYKSSSDRRKRAYNIFYKVSELMYNNSVRMQYKHPDFYSSNGYLPFIPFDTLATDGLDCNNYVAWGLNIALADLHGFEWRQCKYFKKIGKNINPEEAKSGDVMATDGHVVFVMYNDPKDKLMIIAEEGANQEIDVYSYSNGTEYTVIDMTEVYTKNATHLNEFPPSYK